MSARVVRWSTGAWPLVLAVVLCAPLYGGGGALLARDLVFLPHQSWTDATWGLDGTAARAVPLDAVVAAVTALVPGDVLARLVLPLVLACAGWGVQRLLAPAAVGSAGVVAGLVGGGAAVWNPFVVERLALGQWALLVGYAALPWVALLAARYADPARPREQRRRAWCGVLAWWGLASLTPTGGVLAGALALVLAVPVRTRAEKGRSDRWRGWWALLAGGAVLQLPWVVPSLAAPGATLSDPAGVEVFAAGSEGGGVVAALLGLGGIWDARSVPASRETWGAPLAAVVVVVVLVLAWRHLAPVLPGRRRWAVVAAGGLTVALLGVVPGGATLLGEVVAVVPGGGLLRDGQKFLAPAVVLVAVCAGVAAGRLAARLVGHGGEAVASVGIVLVGLPLVLLPDATSVTWPTVRPVDLPDYAAVDTAIAEAGGGDVATLPWRSYRRPAWGNGLVASDPAPRLLDTRVLVSDRLQVGDVLLAGESRRAAAVDRALARKPVAEALAGEGVRWVLLDADDPVVDTLDLSGLQPVLATDHLTLLEVPDPAPAPPPAPAVRRVLAIAAHLAALALVVTTALAAGGAPHRARAAARAARAAVRR